MYSIREHNQYLSAKLNVVRFCQMHSKSVYFRNQVEWHTYYTCDLKMCVTSKIIEAAVVVIVFLARLDADLLKFSSLLEKPFVVSVAASCT